VVLFQYFSLESKKVVNITGENLPQNWIENPSNAIKTLQKEHWAPGLFLVFSSLCFCNAFQLLGSYAQNLYLKDFQTIWEQFMLKLYSYRGRKFGFLEQKLPKENFNLLSYARLPKKQRRYALDIWGWGETINLKTLAEKKMFEFWADLPYQTK